MSETTKRLNWFETLWTIYEKADGGVLIIPDDKEVLKSFWTDLDWGCVVYDYFGITYTQTAWQEQIEDCSLFEFDEGLPDFWLVDEDGNPISDRYLRPLDNLTEK